MDEAGKKLGLRIIAPDRPGISTSEFQPGRVLTDWPPLLLELADHLSLDKFYVMGVSGGGPYVLVCAHAMPERLLGAGVICGAPPLREVGTQGLFWAYRLAMLAQRLFPFTVPLGLRAAAWITGRTVTQWPQTWMAGCYPPEDQRAMANPRNYRIAMEAMRAALFSAPHAVRWDGNIYSSDWGFDLAEITAPVHFWHGAEDTNIPLALARKAAARIPGATFKVYPQDGHNSLPLFRAEEMAAEMLRG
jgi:pimeloyl-ACP methyl ester carboxylesterase